MANQVSPTCRKPCNYRPLQELRKQPHFTFLHKVVEGLLPAKPPHLHQTLKKSGGTVQEEMTVYWKHTQREAQLVQNQCAIKYTSLSNIDQLNYSLSTEHSPNKLSKQIKNPLSAEDLAPTNRHNHALSVSLPKIKPQTTTPKAKTVTHTQTEIIPGPKQKPQTKTNTKPEPEPKPMPQKIKTKTKQSQPKQNKTTKKPVK